jgi:hypothetical protein
MGARLTRYHLDSPFEPRPEQTLKVDIPMDDISDVVRASLGLEKALTSDKSKLGKYQGRDSMPTLGSP